MLPSIDLFCNCLFAHLHEGENTKALKRPPREKALHAQTNPKSRAAQRLCLGRRKAHATTQRSLYMTIHCPRHQQLRQP
eukprot:452993-Amphidinium_carterae.1